MERIESNDQTEQQKPLAVLNNAEKENNPTLVLLNTIAKDVQKDIEWNFSLSSRKSERWNLQVEQVWKTEFNLKSYDCQTKFSYDGKNVSIGGLMKWPASEISSAFRVMNMLNSATHENQKNPNGVNLDYTDGKKFTMDGDSIVSRFNVPGGADSSEAKQKYFDLALVGHLLPHKDDKKAQKEDMEFLLDFLNSR